MGVGHGRRGEVEGGASAAAVAIPQLETTGSLVAFLFALESILFLPLSLTIDTMICRSSFAVAGATSRKKLHSSFLSRKNACPGKKVVRVRHAQSFGGGAAIIDCGRD